MTVVVARGGDGSDGGGDGGDDGGGGVGGASRGWWGPNSPSPASPPRQDRQEWKGLFSDGAMVAVWVVYGLYSLRSVLIPSSVTKDERKAASCAGLGCCPELMRA